MAIQVSRDEERKLRLDGAMARGQAALSKVLPVLHLTPHVNDLISGSPGDRRRFLDWGAFYWSGGNAESFASLRRALLQRNTALRSGILDGTALEPWERQIALFGEAVDNWRRSFLYSVKPLFEMLCRRLELGIELDLEYKNGWGSMPLLDALRESRSRDVKMRTSVLGPQRADFDIKRSEDRAADTLSRGQLKVANLALTLSQLQAAVNLGISPVLCLDDIGAELDKEFLSRVWQEVLETKVQVLATGVDIGRIGLNSDCVRDANVFHVKHGIVELD